MSIVCGNGRIDPGEVCDDGNLLFGDQCNPTCNSFSDVHVVSATEAYAIASEDEDGVLLAWNGTSWLPMTGAPLGQRVWGRAANDLYVGGSDVSHWDGVHWESAGTRVGGVASISGSATDVFVANYTSTILQFDGSVWHRVDTGLPEPGIGAVAAAPDGFAVATGKRMSRYVGSGWTGPSGTQLNLNGISADVKHHSTLHFELDGERGDHRDGQCASSERRRRGVRRR